LRSTYPVTGDRFAIQPGTLRWLMQSAAFRDFLKPKLFFREINLLEMIPVSPVKKITTLVTFLKNKHQVAAMFRTKQLFFAKVTN